MKMRFCICFCLIICFSSCSTLGFLSGQSWPLLSGRQLGTAELGTIRVDKNTDWDSVEAEARRLLPLLLSEAGYKPGSRNMDSALAPKTESHPVFTVEAALIEREYMENWKILRSLSAEVIIRQSREGMAVNKDANASIENNVPVAAGKAALSGTKSLSSSKMLHKLLKSALSNALRALPKT